MKFARIGPAGQEAPAVLHDDDWFDLSPLTVDIDAAFLESIPTAAIAAALAEGSLARVVGHLKAVRLRFGPPIARPSAVLCIGLNYAAHAAESGADLPEHPVLFLKHPNTVVGPNEALSIPPRSDTTDYEVELGVVIGRSASYLASPADSLAHIAGFVLGNDLSERDAQLRESGGQWGKGKSAPGFAPIGPFLVTPDEFSHADARLRTWINGELRQDSSTADMIFDVEFLIWHLSQYLRLDTGDLVLTGTPEGVAASGRYPFLRDGDVCEMEIDGLGTQQHVFTAL